MSKKYYVVWKGAKPGIYDSWPAAKSQTEGRADAQFMGFPSLAEAQKAYQSSYTKALTQRSLQKKPTNTKKVASHSTQASSTIAEIAIYCDGACSPNPGKSGTGVAIYEQNQLTSLWYGLFEKQGTNNTAELNGMLKAFQFAQHYIKQQKHVQILSDSKYSIDCITKWAIGWQAKGWTRGKGEAIKNLELIQQCFQLYQAIKQNITISHVKGHANIEGNELSDRMAVLARSSEEKDFIRYNKTLDIPTILAMTAD